MLTSTFIHLPGLGLQTENKLHEQGITTWDDLITQKTITGISKKRLLLYKQLLKTSKNALLAHDEKFFAAALPLAEHHRAFHHFKEEALYADIEVDKNYEITIVTFTDGIETKVLVKGINLYKEELQRALQRTKLLITYNGAAFDLPQLQKQYGITWKGLHIDLKTVARRQGYTGGLKTIEQQFGLTRDYEEKLQLKIKGGDPAQLYRMWRGSGDEYYLQLLLDYNEADAYHLWLLAKKLLVITS